MPKQNRRPGGGADRRKPGPRPKKSAGSRGAGPGSKRAAPPTGKKPRSQSAKGPARAERSGWGSVARHGAAGATHGQRADEAEGPRTFSEEEQRRYAERQARRAATAARIEGLRGEAKAAIDRAGTDSGDTTAGPGAPTIDRHPLPGRPPHRADVRRELIRRHGAQEGERSHRRYLKAARQFEAEQYTDARRTLRSLVADNPELADFRELLGLTEYRLGKWARAIDELERFRVLAGTTEQHPPLMDAHRALGHWSDVEWLWGELGESSPAAALVVEGRIVRAGAEADRGELDAAIRLLEKGWKPPKRPQEHHLRRAYALADLYERAGRLPRSRSLFGWIQRTQPGYLDVPGRLRSLG